MDTYRSTNTLNGKFYIGSTTDFERRKKSHLSSKENYPFQNALRKNPDAFVWEVWTDDSDEPILEQALLDMWFGKEQCYNLNPVAGRPPNSFEICSKGGNTVYSLGVGIHSQEWLDSQECLEQRKKNGEKVLKEGKGMFSLTQEEKVEVGRKVGLSHYQEKVGLFNPEYSGSEKCTEDRRRGGITQGYAHLENQTGLFDPEYLGSDKKKEDSKKGGSSTCAQVWESTHDGYRNNPGNVAQHNRKNGWDPDDRVRVS